jgi:hypothetical protein
LKGGLNQLEAQEFAEKAEKKRLKEEESFLFSLTKTVNVIKQSVVEEGEYAKETLCAYFKENGTCPNGDACEFSHDLNIQFNVKSKNLLKLQFRKVLSTSTPIYVTYSKWQKIETARENKSLPT